MHILRVCGLLCYDQRVSACDLPPRARLGRRALLSERICPGCVCASHVASGLRQSECPRRCGWSSWSRVCRSACLWCRRHGESHPPQFPGAHVHVCAVYTSPHTGYVNAVYGVVRVDAMYVDARHVRIIHTVRQSGRSVWARRTCLQRTVLHARDPCVNRAHEPPRRTPRVQ